MTAPAPALSLTRLLQMMTEHGVRRVYAKVLAANDNSKNQPYFGGDFSVLNILPAGSPEAATSGSNAKPIFKAPLNFAWLSDSGKAYPAPYAQLILYPQYPEVRFSGYLRGCEHPPSGLMGLNRSPGRILFLGVRDDGQILGHAVAASSAAANELHSLKKLEEFGVFVQVPIVGIGRAATDRAALLSELCRISHLNWILGKKLNGDGTVSACNSPNCGGYTLEAELGIAPNGYAEPDYRGWEVKQYGVSDFMHFRGGPVTLMTPEPTGGVYRDQGVLAFVELYGYEDRRGRPDRLNFGGTHRYEVRCPSTGLTLKLLGYDAQSRRISDTDGGIVLIDGDDEPAALWRYTDLMKHWNRKHATAAYVASLSSATTPRSYRYSRYVRLGTGTDFLRFLDAVAKGLVYYDPGIKIENYSTKPRSKRRSQFRIANASLHALYDKMEVVDACGV